MVPQEFGQVALSRYLGGLTVATMHFQRVHTCWLYGTVNTSQESENLALLSLFPTLVEHLECGQPLKSTATEDLQQPMIYIQFWLQPA